MALLATMMAIALMTIIVMDFTSSSALGYLSAANNANEIRATYLARSAVNVGLALIAQDTRAQLAAQQSGQSAGGTTGGATGQTTQQGSSSTTGQGPFDSFASVWAIPFPPIPVNGGTVSVSVVDEARKFNINRLITMQPGGGSTPGVGTPSSTPLGASAPIGSTSGVGTTTGANAAAIVGQPNPIAIPQFTNLIGILGLNPDIVPCVLDWLDADSIESPSGAESDYYLGLKPPYQPRNGLMPTLGDLRLVKGVDDTTFAMLRKLCDGSTRDRGQSQHRVAAGAGLSGAAIDCGSKHRQADHRGALGASLHGSHRGDE